MSMAASMTVGFHSHSCVELATSVHTLRVTQAICHALAACTVWGWADVPKASSRDPRPDSQNCRTHCTAGLTELQDPQHCGLTELQDPLH